jgi:hypothetical protein
MHRYVAIRRRTRSDEREEPIPSAVPKRAILAKELPPAGEIERDERLAGMGLQMVIEPAEVAQHEPDGPA